MPSDLWHVALKRKGKGLVSRFSKKLPLAHWKVLGPALPKAALWGARRLTGLPSRYGKAHPRGPLPVAGPARAAASTQLPRSQEAAPGSYLPGSVGRAHLLVSPAGRMRPRVGKPWDFGPGLLPPAKGPSFPLSPQTRTLQLLKLKPEPPTQSESFFNS